MKQKKFFSKPEAKVIEMQTADCLCAGSVAQSKPTVKSPLDNQPTMTWA